MKTMHLLSLTMILALPLAVGCSDDETTGAGGSGGSTSSSASGASGGTGATGGDNTGAAGAQGGGGAGAQGGGGAGATGGAGGSGEGGSGGGGSAQAQAFCDSYETICTFVTVENNEPHWDDTAACVAGYDALPAPQQACVETHLDNASTDETPAESSHCWHAIGAGPCEP